MRTLFTCAMILSLSTILHSQIILNEIQSSNQNTLADEFGDYDDWIEIRNLGAIPINIGGLILKDNVDTWLIPDGGDLTTIPANGYILFWCDDEEETEGVFHTNFKLSAENGEYLGLLQPDSVTVIDEVMFPPMGNNIVFHRCPNEDSWSVHNLPTPLDDNDCANSISESEIFNAFYQKGSIHVQAGSSIQEIQVYSLQGKLLDSISGSLGVEHIITNSYEQPFILVIKAKKNTYSKLIIN